MLDSVRHLWSEYARCIEAELPSCCGTALHVIEEVVPAVHRDCSELRLIASCPLCHYRHYGQYQLTGAALYRDNSYQRLANMMQHISRGMAQDLREAIVEHKKKGGVQQTQLPVSNTMSNVSKILQKHYLPAVQHQLNSPSWIGVDASTPKPDTETADIAEWLTHKLVTERGKLHVTKLGGLNWKPQRIIDVADDMGFVQWPHLLLPKEHPLAA